MFLMDIPNKNSEDNLKRLIKDSRLEMPFSDFEDKVMDRIKNEVSNEKVIDRNIRLSWLFFVLGTVFGMLLSVILSPVNTILGISVSKLFLSFYIVSGTLLLLFVEHLWELTFKHRKQRQ